jgi:signal transduction histidine kinase
MKMVLKEKREGLIIFFLSIWLSMIMGASYAQTHHVPLSKPENIQVIENIQRRTNDLVGKNMNRFAYEKLVRYKVALDSLYKIEKRDTLAAIEKEYLSKTSVMRADIDQLNKQIEENTTLKNDLENRYKSLVKKVVISFGLWLIIVIILLQVRKSKLKQADSKLHATNVQLKSLEAASSNAEKLITEFTNYKDPLRKLNEEYKKVNELLVAAGNATEDAISASDIAKKSEQVKKSLDLEEKIIAAVISQGKEPDDEKVSTDINALCEQYVEIASRCMLYNEEFVCQVTKDFEKRLPAININSSAIGTLLLNILSNSFISVKDQYEKGVKGYQPKVAISTRILPRFLQIRIRDNGTGMSEQILNQATDEFFSSRPLQDGSGLGLYVANNIIKEMHKGEIKIESENGASTDVYIKFFI